MSPKFSDYSNITQQKNSGAEKNENSIDILEVSNFGISNRAETAY